MRQTAWVKEVNGNVATVEVTRSSACEGCKSKEDGTCSACSLLGSGKKASARADNSIGAKVGDRVEVETPSQKVILYAAVIFLMPIVLGLLGFLLGSLISQSQAVRYGISLAGFVAAFVIAYFVFDKKAAKRTDVKIIRIIPKDSADSSKTEVTDV